MIKNKKTNLDELAKETFSGTQVGVLIEQFSGEVKVLAEGISTLSSKMDRMESKLDATFEAVGDIKMELRMCKRSPYSTAIV
mgnify:CR=1 FL=1